jgi:hypothetical protein
VVEATDAVGPTGSRLGEGGFPPALNRVNFGAFLLAFLWAPVHRLWGWFAVFVLLEGLESAMGLSAPGAFGGIFEQPAVTVGFRVVYWAITLVFALRANRLVWEHERTRTAATDGASDVRRSRLVTAYASDQRIWAIVGLILLAVTPLSLLIGSVRSVAGAAGDVAVTVGTQTVLLAGLFVYDRVRLAPGR